MIRVALGFSLLVVFFFWAYRDLRRAFFVFLVLIPLTHKEFFGLGVWNLTVPRVALVGVLLGGLVGLLQRSGSPFHERLDRLRRDRVFLLLSILWVVRLASIYWSRNLYASFSLLAFYTAMIGFYVVLDWSKIFYGTEFIHSLLKFYLVVVVASGFWSIAQYVFFYAFGVTLPGAVWPTEYQPLRVGSFFWDINHYAAYLVTAIPTVGLLTVRESSVAGIWRSKAWWLVFAFSLLVSGMTLSRSGWGALFLALLLSSLLLFLRRSTRKEGVYLTALLLGVAAVAVLGSLFLGFPFVQRLGTFFDVYNSDSIKAHLSILRGSYELFLSHPVLGVGYGSFSEHFAETPEAVFYFSKDPVWGNRLPAHSVWGETLSETGVLGFTTFLALISLILYKIFGRFWQLERDWPYHLGAFSSIVGLLFSGIFYSYNLIFFWLYIFLSFNLVTLPDEKN